jgi:hypothetical protein
MSQSIAYLFILIFGACLNQSEVYAQSNASRKTNLELNDTIFYPDWGDKYDSVWFEYERLPEFPGGEEALKEYIKKTTNYPQHAIIDGIEGLVGLAFIIKADGTIGESRFLRKVRDDLDNECLRVVKEMPRWKSGTFLTKTDKGWYQRPIDVWFVVHFNFLLHKNLNARGIVIEPK